MAHGASSNLGSVRITLIDLLYEVDIAGYRYNDSRITFKKNFPSSNDEYSFRRVPFYKCVIIVVITVFIRSPFPRK